MNTVGTKRKLTTILAADVVGYSRLVAADDESTVRRLHAMRDVIGPLVARHDGRLFGEAGDSLMAEFPSAVEAVRCALEMQEEVAARNVDVSPERAMSFRIGIDIGEVIVEGENLYGDGVNIAARLQEIAQPGGIVLSAAAHDQVKNKVSIDIEPLGSRNLKNIPNAVSVFRVRISRAPVAPVVTGGPRFDWRRRAAAAALGVVVAVGGVVAWNVWAGPNWQLRVFKAEAAQPVPVEPSIIVMPFLNASENEAQEYFCLGIAEDILTSLTKVKGLFVVGRDSAMSFKGKPVPARQVARELGVRYVLQGSVRRAEDRVRISTYLVDAATEQTVWAARYDRQLGDIFAVQDEIAGKIVNAVSVSFSPGERENLRQVAQVPASYDLFVQARQKMIPPSPQNLKTAEELFEKVTKSDPHFAGGHAGLSLASSLRVTQGFVRDATELQASLKVADESANAALKADSRSAMALFAKASSELQRHNSEAAVQFAREAFEIQPGDAYIAASLGLMHTFNGQPKEAYKYLERAIERERVPIYRARAEYFMLQAAYMAGDYRRAEQAYHAHLEAGGTCFSDGLFFAAATKAALAVTGKSPDETRAFNDQAASILKELRSKYPTYEIARLPERMKLYRENGDRLKIQRTARTLGAFAPSSTSQP